jgi:hypothetical protein
MDDPEPGCNIGDNVNCHLMIVHLYINGTFFNACNFTYWPESFPMKVGFFDADVDGNDEINAVIALWIDLGPPTGYWDQWGQFIGLSFYDDFF